jgi:hypothetical protein
MMQIGNGKNLIVMELSENVFFCGVCLSGTEVAIGSLIGTELAYLYKTFK